MTPESASVAPVPGPTPPAAPAIEPEPLTLDIVQEDEELSHFISAADRVMEGLGYTEHGFRHANLSARIAYNVMMRGGLRRAHGEPRVRGRVPARRGQHDLA